MFTLWTKAERARAARQSLLVPTPPTRPSELDKRVFRGSTVVAKGLLTRKQLRSSAWRRLRQDVYADARLPVTHRLMISAVGLVMPEGAGFTGLSAATLWGVPDVASANDPGERYDGSLRVRHIVLTDGVNGGTLDGSPYTASPADRIVDTYGAGDSFAAPLAVALARGDAPRSATELGARAGAAVIGGAGPYESQLAFRA